MTLNEAISILNNCLVLSGSGPMRPLPQALQLGSESLKRLQQDREHYPAYAGDLLPSETKE